MATQDNSEAQKEELTLNGEGNPQIESDDSDPKVIRYKQMMAGSKAEAERAIAEASQQEVNAIDGWTQAVLSNNERFLELYSKNPTLADKVAKNFEGISSAKELLNYIKGTSTPSERPQTKTIDEDGIAKRVREQIAREDAMGKAEKQFENLTEEQEEFAKKHFTRLTQGMAGLSTSDILEYAEMAATHARSKLSSGEKDRAMLELAAGGIGNRAATPKGKVDSSKTDELAKAFGFNFTPKK